MEVNEIIAELRRMQVKIGSLTCLSCDHCGVRGCEIIREAADKIEVQAGLLKYGSNKIHGLERELKEEKKNGWISVKDRLPDEKNSVLILCKNGAMFTGYRLNHIQNYDSGWMVHTVLRSTKKINKGRVTHWMPLPEPPKEDDNG